LVSVLAATPKRAASADYVRLSALHRCQVFYLIKCDILC
jgi:hypothetical protein